MSFHKKTLLLFCESPLHAGAGTGIGSIDNPIQREKHTQFPKVEGSSLKGALRQRFWSSDALTEEVDYLFGPDLNEDSGDQAYRSAIQLDDARLLLFPVQSAKGVFAYVTCPWVLEHFFQCLAQTGITIPEDANPDLSDLTGGLATSASAVVFDPSLAVLEDCVYELSEEPKTTELAKWISAQLFGSDSSRAAAKKIQNSLVILPDQDFRDFVVLSTEVITRNKIDPGTGIVKDGALFSEEYLNQESLLYTSLACEGIAPKVKEDAQKAFAYMKDEATILAQLETQLHTTFQHRFQLGASATIGKGMIYAQLVSQPQTP